MSQPIIRYSALPGPTVGKITVEGTVSERDLKETIKEVQLELDCNGKNRDCSTFHRNRAQHLHHVRFLETVSVELAEDEGYILQLTLSGSARLLNGSSLALDQRSCRRRQLSTLNDCLSSVSAERQEASTIAEPHRTPRQADSLR